MNYEKLKVLGDRVLVRISQKSIQDMYSKKIVRNDGTETRLFISVPADDKDDRKSQLFVRTGTAINTGRQVRNIKIGDTVILSYDAFNDERKFLGMEGDDRILWVHEGTTYHDKTLIAYADRQERNGRRVNRKDQKVWERGDINEMSQVIGIIRGDKLIANDPYVFLNHQPHEIDRKTKSGIMYTDKEEILERTVLSVPGGGVWYGMKEGDSVLVKESDVFDIILEDKKVTCVNDTDVLYVNTHEKKLKAV